MKAIVEIRLAITDDAVNRCFPIMKQLRPHLVREDFATQVHRQREGGYQLAYLEDSNAVRTVAGFRVEEKLAHGVYLYVDDLVTDVRVRSGGYGAAMLDWLANFARGHGCALLALDSGVQRGRAHRFYFTHGLQISGYRFQQALP